ncbi:MAG TPA: response regulator [Roseiflexaceae bacterium]|nr:response regulator [Roseiflexaceae bacterium]
MRVLIVDDNKDILQLVQQVLQVEGHEVIVAHDGLEAVLREATTEPDVVVCDINLPGISGWEVCKRIKARRNVPLMLLTVHAEQGDIERSVEVGADDHMSKPFDLSEFVQRIEALAAHRT